MKIFWVDLVLVVLLTGASARGAETFFITEVVDYSPGNGVTEGQGFGIPDRILDGPLGAGNTAGSLDVLTLGIGGSVTVAFDTVTHSRRVFDAEGPDLIVFENAFYIGGNPENCYAELAFVDVSSDGEHFARVPSESLTPRPVGPFGGIDPADVSGLSGAHPVLANVDTNEIDPFDPEAAGGDAFDLAALADDPLVLAGLVQLDDIRYVRLVDILGDGSVDDSSGNDIYDPTGFQNSCDIDAVSVIHGCTDGDADADGTLTPDDAPGMIQALLYPDSVSPTPCTDVNADGVVDGDDVQAWVMALAGDG